MHGSDGLREDNISIGDIQFARFRLDSSFEAGSTVTWNGGSTAVLNDLHRRVIAAHQLSSFHAEQLAELGLEDDVYAIGDAYAAAIIDSAITETSAKRLELDAVAQAYAYAHQRGEAICYVNDLARLQGGFDLVSTRSSSLVVTEIKGTTRLGNATWFQRLGRTRHKGLQLSHHWVWSSFLETGLFSTSAGFFLRYLRAMIAADYVRRLIVVEVGGSAPPQLVEETALLQRPELASAADLSRARSELVAIDAAWPSLVPADVTARSSAS